MGKGMTDSEKIMKTLKHRIAGMANSEEMRNRPGLRQQVEEIGFLLEMLEPKLRAQDKGRSNGPPPRGY